MSIEWYRVYHGMPEDAKLKVISKRSGQSMAHVVTVWLCVLDSASRHKTRGMVQVDSEEIAVVQDIDQAIVESILQAFYEKSMIDQNNRLTGWDKRQYATGAERVEKHRQAKKQSVTPSNATKQKATVNNGAKHKNMKNSTDTDTDTDYRSDTERELDSDSDSDSEKDSDKKNRTHTEKRESEREKQKIGGIPADQWNQILEQMLDIWNTEVQSKLTKGQKAILTPKRRQQMQERWDSDFRQDMKAWRYYCEIIGASNFCLGKRDGKEGGKAWTINLSWAVASSDNVARIMEGGFSGGNHPAKPPACNVPELEPAWENVLQAFQKKYGVPTYRSWLGNTIIARMRRHGDGSIITLRCSSNFIRDWIARHYLSDLCRWFGEATKNGARVTGVELITENEK